MAIPVYVHIPFCVSKCRYCDFNSFAGQERLIEPYLRCLLREITSAPSLLAPSVELRASSVYLGGGTPSLLTAALIAAILKAIATVFPWASGTEITLEANPGTFEAK